MAKIFRGLFRGLWDEVLVELLKGGFKGGKELFAERVKTYIQNNPRAALVTILLSLEPDERANLMEARRRIKEEGGENRFVVQLGEILPRMSDRSVNKEAAREILKQLNEVSADELDEFIEFLNHDPIAEWFRYWIMGKGKEAVGQVSEPLAELVGFGIHSAGQISEAVKNGFKAAAENWPEFDRRAGEAILEWRASQNWLKRSRHRQDRLENQMRELRERRMRERTIEAFERFRREAAEWRDQ